jgi:diadenosine tetraphosphate (Ap4A) HIT family hydrolase
VLEVARAIEVHLHPVKVNYNVLGNSVPHLHTHIVPRYADDPRPGWPFPFPDTDPPPFEQRKFTADVEALRRLIDQTNSGSA